MRFPFRNMMLCRLAPSVGLVVLYVALGEACFSANAAEAPLAGKIDFSRDIQPILSENCYHCHGPDEKTRDGERRLDLRQGAIAEVDGVRAIVPGKSGESDLITRITSGDRDEVMPPPKTHKQLKPSEIALLKRWIDEGAEYTQHWAFVAPQRPAPLPVKDTAWPRTAIDHFILARLEKEQLAPSPEAERATLLRRLSLDLTGLPPSPPEIDAFLADQSPDAYKKQVERLLASPRYGERWARWWLDAARYADSDGYEKDLPRQQWAWRDWVIKVFNDDKPYDQFVVEQIAGDLLPDATQDQRIATGFIRNSMVSEEGAILAEQYRMEAMFDRMDALGKSVLGLTVQCAQCHTHKFDPLTQEEYFRMFAFLNNTYEATSWVYEPAQMQEIDRITREITATEQRAKELVPNWEQRLATWEEEARTNEVKWTVLYPSDSGEPGGIIHPETLSDGSVLTLGFRPTTLDFYSKAEAKLPNITGIRVEALTHGDLIFGGPGRSYKGTFAISELIVESAPANEPEKRTKLALKGASADFAQPEQPIEEFFRKGGADNRIIGPAAFLIDGRDETAWGVDRGPGRRHRESKAVLQLAEPLPNAGGAQLKFILKYKHGGEDGGHGRKNNFLGRVRFSVTDAPNPAADPLPKRVRDAITTPRDQRSAAEQAEIFSYWRTTVPELAEINQQIEALWKQYPEGRTVLNIRERAPEMTRETHMLQRGAWDKPDRVVTPGVPAFLHPLPEGAKPDRLTFARWLVDRRSPTTARVLVNRVWQSYFGTGLVETPEDFGTRAALPSHPELLDWLAVEFMDSGWSLKKLHRLIVESATYQQVSKVRPELLERDPANRLLARGPRFRADGEMVRDIALSASGLLHEKLGGPSIFPPVPESLMALSFINVDFWQTATGPERYRRGLYVFRRRSMPDPVLSAFDAPTGEVSCTRRIRSNTPLAALTSLNEPVFVECAQALALRTLREGGTSEESRAEYAFRLCTGRVPKPEEVARIVKLLDFTKGRIAEGWLSTREVTTGKPEQLPTLPPGTNPAQAAAWTVASRVLLNLDETITKN